MHAAVIHSVSQPPRYEEFQDPEPREGEVLIRVRGAGLHPIVKALAAGSHYMAGGGLPMVAGLDGVGALDDGQRVYFGFTRKPFGTMCERTVALRNWCLPLPQELDDAVAAALVNPGMSAWLTLRDRAGLAAGETVFISGASGVAGRMAVQFARHLGAARVVGSGRNGSSLEAAGLDAMIRLDQPEEEIQKALAAEVERGIHVVVDYLWGRPAELFFQALSGGFRPDKTRSIRYVQVGDSAGKVIPFAGAVLRSVDLRLMGSGFGSVSVEGIFRIIPELFALAVEGRVKIDVERVPLRDVEQAWSRKTEGSRIVFVP